MGAENLFNREALMQRHIVVSIVGALFLAAALAACGGDESTPTSTTDAEPTPTATTGSASTPTVTSSSDSESTDGMVAVLIQNFTHEDLTIEVGTTVTWTNRDPLEHTTTSGALGARTGVWDSGDIPWKESYSFTFTEVGVYPYYCARHPANTQLKATVTVTAAAGG